MIILAFVVMVLITIIAIAYPLWVPVSHIEITALSKQPVDRTLAPRAGAKTAKSPSCFRCHRPFGPDEFFCPRCGAPAPSKCPGCARVLVGDEIFCPGCGRRISEPDPTAGISDG